MKQKILSLVTLVVFGTGVISAQTNDVQDKHTVCPEMKCDNATCPGDSAHFRHMRGQRHGQRPHFGQAARGGQQFGNAQGQQFAKNQMRKRHGMRRNMPRIKSTPKCKCATCVELRKQEDILAKMDSMRKEMHQLKHELDSLRGFVPQKGNMPPAGKQKK